MLKDLFSNRLFIGALAFFILCVGGSLLYMQQVKKQTAEDLAAHDAHIKALTEKQNSKMTAAAKRNEDTPQQSTPTSEGTVQQTEVSKETPDGTTPITEEKLVVCHN